MLEPSRCTGSDRRARSGRPRSQAEFNIGAGIIGDPTAKSLTTASLPLRFPNQRELPAFFAVNPDGSEHRPVRY
jgi:hypothetical protein